MNEYLRQIEIAKENLGELFEPSIQTYVEECSSLLNDLKDSLLERESWDLGVIQSVLRHLHTLKGTSGVMGFKQFATLIHRLEDFFIRKSKEEKVPPPALLFSMAEFCDLALFAVECIAAHKDPHILGQSYVALLACVDKILKEIENPTATPLVAAQVQAMTKANNSNKEQSHALSNSAFDSIFWTLLKNAELISQLPNFKDKQETLGELERAIFTLTRSRVSPLSKLTNKLKQLVQGLADQLGKQVNFSIQGFEAEVDSHLLRAFSEILTHMLRNAMDHGIETRERRNEQGKPLAAELTLEFAVNAERTMVRLVDDGAGINGEYCAQKALQKGLISEQQFRSMTAYEKQELIFLPGFSTKEVTTEISGRGVGMDAVMTEIKKHGGTIVIDSTLNKGTSFIMEFPAPFMYNQCLLFRYDDQFFSLNLEHIIGYQPDYHSIEYDTGIARVHGIEEEFLVIGLEEIDLHYGDSARPFVMLNLEGAMVGFWVDEIIETRRLLVFASERTSHLPIYLNGISTGSNLGSVFNIDTTAIKRDLNLYMIKENVSMSHSSAKASAPADGLHLFDEEEVDAPTPISVPQASVQPQSESRSHASGFLPPRNSKALDAIFSSDAFTNELNHELSLFVSNDQHRVVLLEEATEIIEGILESTDDATDNEVFEILLSIEYCNIKSKWLKYNTQVDLYEKIAPDVVKLLLGKIAVISTVLRILESVVPAQSLVKISRILGQAISSDNAA